MTDNYNDLKLDFSYNLVFLITFQLIFGGFYFITFQVTAKIPLLWPFDTFDCKAPKWSE